MRCEEFERIVFEGGEATQEMLEHAKACEACRVLLENADVLAGSAKLDEEMELPPSFAQAWRAAVRREAAKGRTPGFMDKTAAWLKGLSRPAYMRGMAFALCAVVLVGVGAAARERGRLEGGIAEKQEMITAYSTAGTSRSLARSADMDAGNVLYSAAAVEETADTAQDPAQKIVRTAQLSLEVADMDAAIADLQAQVQTLGGTVSYCEISGQKGEERFGSMEVSVPSGALNSFLGTAGGIGKVMREVTQQTDMTESYYDNASRLESARAQKQRLDELYAQAQDMTDVVAITDALFEVQQEIDSLTGQNAWIDSRVALSRVNLTLTEPADEQEETAFLKRVADSFADGLSAIGEFFGSLVLFVVWALPWVALIAAIGAAAYLIGRFMKRK